MGKFKVGQWVRSKEVGATCGLVGVIIVDDMTSVPYLIRFNGFDVGHGKAGNEWWLSGGEVEPWQPKVGERVLLLEDYGRAKKGAEGIVTGFWRDGISVDFNGAHHSLFTRRVAPITDAAPAAAPLKIEAGKFYKTRDGRKVGPMVWGTDRWFVRGELGTWNGDGSASNHHKPTATEIGDLVALWEEPAVAVAASNDNAAPAKPKFKVGDRVLATKSVGYIDAGKTYEVIKVDDEDEVMPVQVVGEGGNRYWLFRSNFEPASSEPTSNNPAIVCLIENGQPKPADRPFVHRDEASASKEASRLAGVHKGKEFGVYVLTSTAKEERTYDHEWQRLAVKGEKIAAIKELRAANTFLSLRSARLVVEDFLEAA